MRKAILENYLIISCAVCAWSLSHVDSLQPHDCGPPGSSIFGGSPGKNTGVGCHFLLQWMKVKSESEVTQSCPTFSDPMDCSLPGSSIHGIFQARVLEWGAIAFPDSSNIIHLYCAQSLLLCYRCFAPNKHFLSFSLFLVSSLNSFFKEDKNQSPSSSHSTKLHHPFGEILLH